MCAQISSARAQISSARARTTSSTRAVLVLELLINHDPDVLRFEDVYALCALDRELRRKVLDHSATWESMTRMEIPSLEEVRGSVNPPRGRNGFLWCRRLSDDTLRVRPTPIPDALRRRVETPKAITFLVDIFTGEDDHVTSTEFAFEFDAAGNIVAVDGDSAESATSFTRYCEFQVLSTRIEHVEALAAASAEARRDGDPEDENFITSTVPARVLFSFSVDGEPPIILLNEFASFFNHEDFMEFRTDVDETWHPHVKNLSVSSISVLRRECAAIFQSGSDLRYGRGSLPFDPIVRLTLSPPGMDKRFDVDEQPLITQDNIDDCFALIEVDFHKGEDQVLADTVVPALMRLREDHKRQPLY